MADYFPLEAGRFWTYEVETPRGRKVIRVEVVSAESFAGSTRAACRSRVDERPWLDFSVVADASSVRVEGVVELPEPPAVGASWATANEALRIADDDAVVETPAGRFEGCLRVVVLIAGGDAGSGERFYAPGLGLVREALSDEAEPSEKSLLSWGMGRP
ncbi:MAG: hypothetical protein HYZ75_04240 [Elusimicrobia bacterium]|nr:hypothetical protein [Elusimicrobiota bacterium]